ncbi:MAG: alcohol dehydrogenase catalytic domain-containing protein [Candidatus Methylomirabilis sp.]|nr:alcohol dehydrogenase catalytic domain-containing protein [Candidatus Methylomirabilis sp.]
MIPGETRNRTMTAAVLHGPEDVRLEEVPIPPIGPRELLARVEAASIDFTDRKVYLRGSHPMMRIPGLFGHEWAGVVAARGQQADDRWQPGMRVVAANSAPCTDQDPAARCRACRRARQGMCERLLYNNGAFAPYLRIPQRIVEVNLYELPAQVPFGGGRPGRAARLRHARGPAGADRRRRSDRRCRSRTDRPAVHCRPAASVRVVDPSRQRRSS